MTTWKRFAAFGAAGLLALSLAACGSSDSNDSASGDNATPATTDSAMPSASSMSSGSTEPFGAACSAVPSSGAGSFTGMSTAPVATAASANPVLSTLVAAVKQAGLVDTLNSAQNITVFAPSNDAFAKIPPATLKQVLADKATLTKILTTHVIGKKLSPSDLAGTQSALSKSTVTVTGSGEDFTVKGGSGDPAKVVCGNVQTANATVYIIDTVLMP